MSYKSKTRDIILSKYKEKGEVYAVNLAKAMLHEHCHKDSVEFGTAVHGELCETVLEVHLIEYIKKHSFAKSWFYKKGLILKDPENPKSDYLTELDLVLFTPQKFFVFECKSYGGDKLVTQKCTLKATKRTFDVYEQNVAHELVLLRNLKSLKLKGEYAYKAKGTQKVLFCFATGQLQDVRTDSWKADMPCCTLETVDTIIQSVNLCQEVWDMQAVRKAVDIIERKSEDNRAKHLNYVKRLHGD